MLCLYMLFIHLLLHRSVKKDKMTLKWNSATVTIWYPFFLLLYFTILLFCHLCQLFFHFAKYSYPNICNCYLTYFNSILQSATLTITYAFKQLTTLRSFLMVMLWKEILSKEKYFHTFKWMSFDEFGSKRRVLD